MSQSLVRQLKARGLSPRKSLGQHYLLDETHLMRIVEAAGLTPEDTVLEIGPGPGPLTRLLAARAGRVVAVETDPGLVAFLQDEFAAQPQVTILHGDILQFDPCTLSRFTSPDEPSPRRDPLRFTPPDTSSLPDNPSRFTPGQGQALPLPADHSRFTPGQGQTLPLPADHSGFTPGQGQAPHLPPDHSGFTPGQGQAPPLPLDASRFTLPYKLVANLPYYITSAVLRHMLESACPPALSVLTVQREVAQRVVAAPPNMSLLAVSVQLYTEPEIAGRIPAGAFYPPPKVDSAILRLRGREQLAVPLAPAEVGDFFDVVRAGFGQKRKQLRNSLSGGLGRPLPEVLEALGTAGIDPQRRAETLALAEWGRLFRALAGTAALYAG